MKSRLSTALLLFYAASALTSAACSSANSAGRPAAAQGAGAGDRALSPTKVVVKYYELAAAGRLQEAKELRLKYMTIKEPGFGPFSEVKIGMPETTLDSEKTIYEKGVRFLKAVSETVEDDKAEVVALIREPYASVVPVIHQLYRQENEWKLFSEVDANNPVCVREPAACHIVKTPAAVVNWYYHYSSTGRIEEARALLATPPPPDLGADSFGPGAEKSFGQKGVMFGNLESETIEGDSAEVLALIMVGGKLAPVRHHLFRQSGAWKIQSYYKN